MSTVRTKTLVVCAMLIAVGVVLSVVVDIPLLPAAPYLKYDPSGIPMQLSALLYGPVYGSIVAVATCIIHGSTDGPIGILMNVLASLFAVIPVGIIYRRLTKASLKKSLGASNKVSTVRNAAVALGVGAASMVIGGILSNLALTPLYLGISTAQVAGMILPILLPFNLIKAVLNAVLTLVIFQAVRKQLS